MKASLSLCAASLLLGGTFTVQAEPTKSPSTSQPTHSTPTKTDSPKTHAKHPERAAHHPRDFRGWTSSCWFPRYRCYGYYSPLDRAWFYWYGPLARFLPVSYMTAYPPVGAPVTTAGLPGLPADAAGPALPAGATATLPTADVPVADPSAPE